MHTPAEVWRKLYAWVTYICPLTQNTYGLKFATCWARETMWLICLSNFNSLSIITPKVFHLAHLKYIFSSQHIAHIRLILSIIQVQNIAFLVWNMIVATYQTIAGAHQVGSACHVIHIDLQLSTTVCRQRTVYTYIYRQKHQWHHLHTRETKVGPAHFLESHQSVCR